MVHFLFELNPILVTGFHAVTGAAGLENLSENPFKTISSISLS